MLQTLKRLVQDVDINQDPQALLHNVVSEVSNEIDADATSIFLLEPELNEYVLVATVGLKSNLIGSLRLKLGAGLVGLVSEREEPINLEDATIHPNYIYHPDASEVEYRGFLGVPMIYQREVLGIIMLQQQDAQRFDASEESSVATLATQLAGLVADAQSSGAIDEWLKGYRGKKKKKLSETVLNGTPSSMGVGIGTGVVVYPHADLTTVPDRATDDIPTEMGRYAVALEACRKEIEKLSDNVKAHLSSEDQVLFEAYLRILDSASISKEIKKTIKAGQWAQGAVKHVFQQQIKKFEAMEDAYLKERASDFRDLGQRILAHLQTDERDTVKYAERTILMGDELTPAALAEVPEGHLIGVVSVKGSNNSHVAILARALGVPTVMGIKVGTRLSRLDGQNIIVDGYYGQVYVAPSRQVLAEFKRLVREEEALDQRLEEMRQLPAETVDGRGVALYVNTGLAADVSRSLSVGAEGVGLYRTEVPFMIRDRFPTEEEQRVLYRQLLSAFAPRPVMVRTLDVGGDKNLDYFPIEEANPFLGWRGIRITLDHPEIFLVQVRAILRASIDLNNAYIMLPMISCVAEVEEAIRLLAQAHGELVEDGHAIKMPPLGVMVEVPSAIYQIRALAQRVDFLSVGSNDLIQYLLAVDRNNARVASLYDGLHPAVLQALVDAVKGAHKEKKHIGVCGEMAGDPVAVILLLAMGFDSLSMSAMQLPRIKWVIRNLTMERAQALLKEVLVMDDASEIRVHMELALEEAGLGGLIRAGN